MDDLSSLEWSSASKTMTTIPRKGSSIAASFPALQPSPSPSISGRSSPQQNHVSGLANGQPAGLRPPSKPSTPSNDSFSNLVSFGSSKPGGNVSLLEQQRRMQEEKRRHEAEQREKIDKSLNPREDQFWDSLDRGRTSAKIDPAQAVERGPTVSIPFRTNPMRDVPSTEPVPDITDTVEDDLLPGISATAAFKPSTQLVPTSKSSNDKRSTTTTESVILETAIPSLLNHVSGVDSHGSTTNVSGSFDLHHTGRQTQSKHAPEISKENEEDILGLLAKPVHIVSESKSAEALEISSKARQASSDGQSEPKEVCELMDMGFPVEKAKQALATTQTGRDVQAAVGWLLDSAHRKAKGRQGNRGDQEHIHHSLNDTEVDQASGTTGTKPAWMREKARTSNRAALPGDKNITLAASNISNNLVKSANNIWKTSKKKVQKAVDEFQQDGNREQPRWMKEAQRRESVQEERATSGNPNLRRDRNDAAVQPSASARGLESLAQHVGVTDEALMLEGKGPKSQTRADSAVKGRNPSSSQAGMSDPITDMLEELSHASKRSQPRPEQTGLSSNGRAHGSSAARRLNRAAVEEQTMQAYISPARRKAQGPKAAVPQTNLIPSSTQQKSTQAQSDTMQKHVRPEQPRDNHSKGSASLQQLASIPAKQKPPKRLIPQVSEAALSSSGIQRQKGSEAFKVGDFSAAHTSYTRALSALPANHPSMIVILCNRSLVNLKNGDPKAAISDAESALTIIGGSRGEGETISLGGAEGEKDMRDFFGKALVRKAESLEQMEKWKEAAESWREAVEAGVGGPISMISIQGRDRCEKAAGIGSHSYPPAKHRPSSAKKPIPRDNMGGAKSRLATRNLKGSTTPQSFEAVRQLRQANAAAERVDDEKFALADSVDARISNWTAGKQDNIRALLVSLDTVLWPEAGWKKVGMHELVIPSKVKMIYMKGIAKVHPDKVSSF